LSPLPDDALVVRGGQNLPESFADFQNLDDDNRLRLTCAGTRADLQREGIELKEGLVLTFYTDDEDDNGQPEELLARGTVRYNPGRNAGWRRSTGMPCGTVRLSVWDAASLDNGVHFRWQLGLVVMPLETFPMTANLSPASETLTEATIEIHRRVEPALLYQYGETVIKIMREAGSWHPISDFPTL
jgi:hypothetical protein